MAREKSFNARSQHLLRAPTLIAAGVIGVCAVLATLSQAGAANTTVVLGRTNVVQYGIGWGTVRPSLIFNGGDPSGRAWHLKWRGWGATSAYALGRTTIPHRGGNYYPKSGVIELRASDIGRCSPHGPRAYTQLQVREAVRPGGRLTRWGPWGGWKTICHAPGN